MDANIKNLRDALEWLDRDIEGEAVVDGEMSNANAIRIGFIRNMLARFPLRNCEVGNEKEQSERYKAYCRKHFTPDQLGGNCRACPLKDIRGWSCQIAWAQMPYEAKEGAGE